MIANHDDRIGFEPAFVRGGHDGFETMCFARHHDGEALATFRFNEPDGDFHSQFGSQRSESGAQGRSIAFVRGPRGLNGHSELTARHFFFERFDVRALRKEKAGHFGDDARLVAADDGDRGINFHARGE